mmetsp:Transcript_5209/g.19558  ORF Transcript_5209/g.19558 Transcript_5209/m.19558 type:complete len:246 (+) Transcript_5209:1877-2614(+)
MEAGRAVGADRWLQELILQPCPDVALGACRPMRGAEEKRQLHDVQRRAADGRRHRGTSREEPRGVARKRQLEVGGVEPRWRMVRRVEVHPSESVRAFRGPGKSQGMAVARAAALHRGITPSGAIEVDDEPLTRGVAEDTDGPVRAEGDPDGAWCGILGFAVQADLVAAAVDVPQDRALAKAFLCGKFSAHIGRIVPTRRRQHGEPRTGGVPEERQGELEEQVGLAPTPEGHLQGLVREAPTLARR